MTVVTDDGEVLQVVFAHPTSSISSLMDSAPHIPAEIERLHKEGQR